LVVVCQIAFGVSVFFALRNSKGQLDKRIEMRLKDHFDTAEQSHLDKIQQRVRLERECLYVSVAASMLWSFGTRLLAGRARQGAA
jgi:hypothetical protein